MNKAGTGNAAAEAEEAKTESEDTAEDSQQK
jgi:hypothetical protein